jgi:hypothetical protein
MKIVQIAGPAYCGSTALGFALNTIPGFFFGSEVLFLLKSERIKQFGSEDRFLRCNNCGMECDYWSKGFYESLREVDSLNVLYEKFSSQNPEVKYFVDASKRYHFFKNTEPFARIVCAKDPLRLLASYLYNKKNEMGIGSEDYQGFSEEILTKSDYIVSVSKKYLEQMEELYTRIFKNEGEFFYFQTDRAHEDNFSVFTDLMKYLKVESGLPDVTNFSNYECHSIGGNRAPLNLVGGRNKKSISSNPRFDYYRKQNEYGDWKLDNKYLEVLPESFRDDIVRTVEYCQLRGLLGYV